MGYGLWAWAMGVAPAGVPYICGLTRAAASVPLLDVPLLDVPLLDVPLLGVPLLGVPS